MKYYERMEYHLSRRFKDSVASELLDYQLDKLPNAVFKMIPFKDESYKTEVQGDKINYKIDDENGIISIFLETEHDFKKKYILLEVKKYGNEVNIITKSPREDTNIFHIRHNSNDTVRTVSRRVKFHNRENEQLLESRYALFSDDGTLLNYNVDNYEYESDAYKFLYK